MSYISEQDRGFLIGDGVFTTMLVDEGKIPFLIDHFKRLQKHCHQMGIIPPVITPEQVKEVVIKNHALKGKWRLRISISGGTAETMDLSPRKHGAVVISIQPLKKVPESMSLCIYPHPVEYPLAQVKTLSYVHRFALRDYAVKKGYDDCLVKDSKGQVLETSFANLFWIRGKTLFYPDPSLPYLFGITLHHIVQVAKKSGLKVEPCRVKPSQLKDTSVYLSNSLFGFIPVVKIDSTLFETDKVIEDKLKISFQELLDNRNYLTSN